uniref:Transcription initiation factor TFIID subunit 1-like n=1 Tax=Saccoglossus kowalevskii TaxID=10224 RepID=A0ABM0LZA8_SACKO
MDGTGRAAASPNESKRHLSQLGRFEGLGSLVDEIAGDAEDEEVNENSGSDISPHEAIDYSDIMEVADEESCNDRNYRDAMNDMQAPSKDSDSDDDYDAEEDGANQSKNDTKLMPPPSITPPFRSQLSDTRLDVPGEEDCDNAGQSVEPSEEVYNNAGKTAVSYKDNYDNNEQSVKTETINSEDKEQKDENSVTKMETMKEEPALTVTQLFPEFRPGKVLRFSKLFGLGKPSSLPHIWRGSKRKRRKKKPVAEDDQNSADVQKTYMYGIEIKPKIMPTIEDCLVDDEVLHGTPMEVKPEQMALDKDKEKECKPKVAEWRYGPAQYWYDLLGVDPTAQELDYGFKLKSENENTEEKDATKPTDENSDKSDEDLEDKENQTFKAPDECFQMVTQMHWEDDVVWNGEESKNRIMNSIAMTRAGWIPTSANRTAHLYNLHMDQHQQQQKHEKKKDTWFSIFPVENEELVYGRWEDKIIWDAQNMERIPSPPMLQLDPNDENLVLGIPDDKDPNQESSTQVKEKKEPRRSKILLEKSGVTKPEPQTYNEIEQNDSFNLSNDEYYNPKDTRESSLRSAMAGLLQHSTPALELRQPFFPTHYGPIKLRSFHRPSIKRYSHGPMASPGFHPVYPLLRQIKKKAKEREQERLASGGGEMFFMRTPEDLTGSDGDLILAEYSEEYPPHIMNVGMATKIKNYYKRKPGIDSKPPDYKYGETVYAHSSPFLGSLQPGQSLQAFENNLFRSPIYRHRLPLTDFLIIKTRQGYYIREIEDIYTVGQLCPLMEVPGPNSKKANNHIRDFLQVFIYRLFWKSKDKPRRIKMEDIKRAFPTHSESSIRKRLKLCADFKRTGMDSNWWVLKPDFRLPTEEEIRAMVSPEQCCAYASMLAAEQRLKDAGYGEKSFLAPDDDNEDNDVRIDDEVRAAPWNTTRAFISAMKGKCLLAITDPTADPTGSGEGFSYIKIPNKPQQQK